MTARNYVLIIGLLFPFFAYAEQRSLTIYIGGCGDSEISADVMYAADQNSDDLKKTGVIIAVDEKKKRCGYDLQKGKRTKRLTSGLTDIDLSEELHKFFGDR